MQPNSMQHTIIEYNISKSNIKEVPMKDINGFVEMMEGVDSGK